LPSSFHLLQPGWSARVITAFREQRSSTDRPERARSGRKERTRLSAFSSWYAKTNIHFHAARGEGYYFQSEFIPIRLVRP